MKNYKIKKLILAGYVLLLAVNLASAADRMRVSEMGESGQTIEFAMTPAEIAAEDAANAALETTSGANVTKSKKQFKVFEMGESGFVVAFPMTAEEIKADNIANAKSAAVRAGAGAKPKRIADGFELAESGEIIEFPVMATKPTVDDSDIAGGVLDNKDLSI